MFQSCNNSLLFFSLAGAEVECVDKYGYTPLHSAAKHGHELLITTLLNNGADVARCVFTKAFKHRDYCSRTHTSEIVSSSIYCSLHECGFTKFSRA